MIPRGKIAAAWRWAEEASLDKVMTLTTERYAEHVRCCPTVMRVLN